MMDADCLYDIPISSLALHHRFYMREDQLSSMAGFCGPKIDRRMFRAAGES